MQEQWQKPFTPDEIAEMRRLARNEAGLLAEVMAMMRRLGRMLPFAEDVLAAWVCVRDPATSNRVRFILLAALAYFVLPLDSVPDFIPVLGFTDDAAVIATALAAVRGSIRDEHRAEARAMLDEERYQS